MANLPESFRDLLDTGTAVVLSTNGRDGYPQTSAIWYLFDEGTIKASLNTDRQKIKNLRRDPRATLFLIDPANPYRTLEVRADVQLIDDPNYEFADKVTAKYGAPSFRERDKGQPGTRVVAIFNPVKVNVGGA